MNAAGERRLSNRVISDLQRREVSGTPKTNMAGRAGLGRKVMSLDSVMSNVSCLRNIQVKMSGSPLDTEPELRGKARAVLIRHK